ncbi:hypothetical protein [Streptomyces stelliscabiei]|uniref:hypothetical protein n=1 Tax=Streptomyces stelliscabiei TaxID=146820 RepID=UPI002FEF6059
MTSSGRWRAAHRAVLDHLVRLVADSPLGDDLVLRGSMVMPAWVGAGAREPADLDWIVPRPLLVPVDAAHPYPYVEGLEAVQQWPEAADGAGRYEMWKFEEFDTQGLRPAVPPEGLHWVVEAEPEEHPPHLAVLDLVRERPVAAPGVVLDASAARPDGTWTYTEYETPGTRLTIPWAVEGLPPGEARLDFARDERLPEPPVWTAVPRGDGSGRTVVRTPGPACPSPGNSCGCTPTAPPRAVAGPRTSTTPSSSRRRTSPNCPRGCCARSSATVPATRRSGTPRAWTPSYWTPPTGRTSAPPIRRCGARPRSGSNA